MSPIVGVQNAIKYLKESMRGDYSLYWTIICATFIFKAFRKQIQIKRLIKIKSRHKCSHKLCTTTNNLFHNLHILIELPICFKKTCGTNWHMQIDINIIVFRSDLLNRFEVVSHVNGECNLRKVCGSSFTVILIVSVSTALILFSLSQW